MSNIGRPNGESRGLREPQAAAGDGGRAAPGACQ